MVDLSEVAAANKAKERAWAESAPQRQYMEAVRRVPDETFAEHPEIVGLREDLSLWEHRSKYITQTRLAEVEKTIAKLQDQLTQATEELRFASLDDAMAGDLEQQPRAVAASQRLDQMRRKLDAARMAREEISRSPLTNGLPGRYLDERARAGKNLQEALLRLKAEHVQAHPELL